MSTHCVLCGDDDAPLCAACGLALASTPESAIVDILRVVWGDEITWRPLTRSAVTVTPQRASELSARLEHARDAAERDPDNVRHWLKVAESAQLAGDVVTAIALYERAIATYMAQGASLKAVAVAKQLQSMTPLDPHSALRLAELLQSLGYASHARAHALRAIQLSSPPSPRAVAILFNTIAADNAERLRALLAR